MSTVKSLAEEMSKAFVGDERNDGTKFRKLRDGRPDWMQDVCFKAHGDMMPDDHRYEFIEEAIDALAEHDSEEDARDSLEADIYTSDLTDWLGSRADRTCYCDDAMEEYGCDFKGVVDVIMLGQLREKQEVFDLVVSALTELAEASEEEEEETDEDEENTEDEED